MAEDSDTTPDDIDDAIGDDIEDEMADDHEHGLKHLVDELRDMPVGTNDPNIIGDAGPLDVPPGSDPPQEGELEE
jgi:hypothetical protein